VRSTAAAFGSGTRCSGGGRKASSGAARIAACALTLFWLLACEALAAVPHYELRVALDPQTRALQVTGSITIPAGRSVALELDGRFEVERFEVDGLAQQPVRKPVDARWYWLVQARAHRAATVRLRYAGVLAPLDAALDHRQVLALSAPVGGPEGAFLPSGSAWYPQPASGRLTYRLSVEVPTSFRAVLPGTLVREGHGPQRSESVFESLVALPAIDLLAGPYVVSERMRRLDSGREVRVRTYFHPELADLASDYLESAGRYLAHYDRTFGPHAFAAYSIVSSPLPTGFGLPGIAYLGRQVVRLPFIQATSLRHEVLHDWWGNGVEPDQAQGNWAEGLTTLLADHAYREEQGEAHARTMRLGWLRDYAAVRTELDRPLSAFVSRRHGADQAVGYNKTAFVFFMLRDRIGPERFRAALQRLWMQHRTKVAGWNDLQRAFESESGLELDEFFRQWVRRPGAPSLHVAAAKRVETAAGQRLRIDVRQEGPQFEIDVPLRILHERGHVDASVRMRAAHAAVDIAVPARAQFVQIDPDVRLFRRLDREEIAPTLRPVLIDPRTRVALAASEGAARAAALQVAQAALMSGVKLFDAGADAIDSPLMIVGLHTDVERLMTQLRLPARQVPELPRGAAFAYAWRTPGGQPFAVVAAADAAQLAQLARPLPHLGAQSYVVFSGVRSVARGIWPTEARRYRVTD
jgi:aminopeptidase N